MKRLALFKPRRYTKKGGFEPFTLIYIDDDGVKHKKSSRLWNRVKAEEWARKEMGKFHNGKSLAYAKKTIMEHIQVNQYAKSTIELYLRVFEILEEIGKPLHEIRVPEVNSFKIILKDNRNTGVNVYLRTLRSILNKAKEFDLLESIPKVELLPEVKDTQTAFEVGQVINLLKFIWNDGKFLSRETSPVIYFRSHLKQIALFEYCCLAYYTGCRRGEILNMTVGDIQDGFIKVIQYKKRGGKRLKRTPIHPDLYNNVLVHKLHLDPKSRLCDLLPDFITSKVKLISRHLGLPESLKQHSFRHTYVTELIKGGIGLTDVSGMVGHTSYNTTLGYLERDTEQDKININKLPNLRLVKG